ncbi:Lipase class 3 family protein [Spironucleus salmonicida]|uniref:Lipase class 3 family protein n=1 Tax=Spironucleus salmonicida TaxID=348837 RepID=V6LM00_9EUKA|nr:Lipase class 3 family protein [Spironucleus salmonicida]|eukprot:EST41734.1 Lipase class 3 family protein [Spironucleus salmonicida]
MSDYYMIQTQNKVEEMCSGVMQFFKKFCKGISKTSEFLVKYPQFLLSQKDNLEFYDFRDKEPYQMGYEEGLLYQQYFQMTKLLHKQFDNEKHTETLLRKYYSNLYKEIGVNKLLICNFIQEQICQPIFVTFNLGDILYVIIRGTKNMKDLISCICYEEIMVSQNIYHEGFYQSANYIFQKIQQIAKNQKIVLVGYSYGGAVAAVLAQLLSYQVNQINCVTFGAPPNSYQKLQFTPYITNIINYNDPICRLSQQSIQLYFSRVMNTDYRNISTSELLYKSQHSIQIQHSGTIIIFDEQKRFFKVSSNSFFEIPLHLLYSNLHFHHTYDQSFIQNDQHGLSHFQQSCAQQIQNHQK